MNGYNQFMIIEIAQNFDVIDEHLEYDEMWVKGAGLLKQFEESKFNVDTKSEHDCMIDFMYEKQQEIKRRKEEEERKKLTGYRNIKVTAIRNYTKQTEFTIEVPKNLSLDELEDYLSNDKKTLLKIEDGLTSASLFSND
jgi:hypothetical protein